MFSCASEKILVLPTIEQLQDACPHGPLGRIGLAGGGEVEIEIDGAGIRIEPVTGNELREREGLLVIPATGTPIDDTGVRRLIEAGRDGR